MTKIEWTERVWNPVTGCTPVSEGCENCYAERMAKRLAGRFGYPKGEPFRVTLHEDRLEQPLHWKKPSLVFLPSMGDLFHPKVKSQYIAEVFDKIAIAKQHTFLIVTKRPKRMKAVLEGFQDIWECSCSGWPFKNVWLGVTVENQARSDERIPILLQIPAAVRFVSVEPMLGPVDIRKYLEELSWVIAGCESGPKRRLTTAPWIRSLKNQCRAYNIPFFLKQMEVDGKIVKMPEFDGREWNEVPEVLTK